MTPEEFMVLVTKMRDAQKAYFKHRSSDLLLESKDLERQVDKEMADHHDKQRNLFGDST